MRNKAWIIAMAFLGGCASLPRLASDALPDSGISTTAPRGYAGFCHRFPRQCRAQPNARTILTITESNWRLLSLVNDTVNKSIKPKSDLAHYGVAEYWTIPSDGFGDCEDFALTKQRDLRRAGLSASALRIAVVDVPNHGPHAVLTVSTDKGDYVLDNVTNQILLWNLTGYVWISVQSHTDPRHWDGLRSTPDSGQATAAQPPVSKMSNPP